MNKSSSIGFWIAILVTITIAISSCKEKQLDGVPIVTRKIEACERSFPFASDRDLKLFEQNSEIINPRLARNKLYWISFNFRAFFQICQKIEIVIIFNYPVDQL